MTTDLLQNVTLGDVAHDFIFHRDKLGSVPMAEGVSSVDSIFMFIFWSSAIVFVGLMVAMVYWSIKYRRRPGTIAPASPSHNTGLELAWSVIPLGFFVYMFFEGFHGYISHMAAPPDSLELAVTGQKWNWTVQYPNGAESPVTLPVGSQNVPVFYVPEQKPVKFRMISRDVIHAFWVPDFRFKIDVQPNRYTSYWFKSEGLDLVSTGTLPDGAKYRDHYVFCAEYCGDLHSEMAAVIRVVPEAYYNQTIAKWNDAVDPVELGKRVWTSRCATCHTIDGGKNTGPTWKGIFGHEVAFTDGTTYTAEQMSNEEFFSNYIRESVLIPAKKIVAGYPNQMPSFMGQLTEPQINGVIQYIKTLK